MAELDTEQQLRATALAEANKFAAFRAAHGSVIPGTKQVLGAAETFLQFLRGEIEGEGEDADGGSA